VFSNGPNDFNVQLRPTDPNFDLLAERIEQLFAAGNLSCMYCVHFLFRSWSTFILSLAGGETLDRSLVAVGTACVARYRVDDNFYRAEIKEVRSDGALVNFVDYGNLEVVRI